MYTKTFLVYRQKVVSTTYRPQVRAINLQGGLYNYQTLWSQWNLDPCPFQHRHTTEFELSSGVQMYDRFCCAEISHWRNFNTDWNYTMRHSRKQWLRGKEIKKHAKTMYHRLLRTSQDMLYTYKISLFLCPFHFQSDLFYPLTAGVESCCCIWSHSDTPHSVGLLCTSDRPVAETFTWQHTTLTRDIPAPRRDSNSQSQQARDHRSKQQTARPLGSAA